MYTIHFGDMWSRWGVPSSLFCISTNSYIRRDGALVMGRGIAKQVRDFQPEVAWDAAKAIRKQPIPHTYGFVAIPVVQPASRLSEERHHTVGLFQVKQHFSSPADLKLIEHSVQVFKAFLLDHPLFHEINLNYPGIGFGHRTVAEVEPLLEHLPSNVNVWRFADER